jgi:hypothetical protein
MNALKRCTAIGELLLLLPASLFMASLFVQHLEPVPPAQAAHHLVEWFSTHVVLGLYVFLVALPFVAFLIGCATVLLSWRSAEGIRRAVLEMLGAVRGHMAILLIAGATVMAGGILAIVGMHMITH